MRDRKRLHRVEPARVEPIRDFSKLYRRPDSANGASPAKPAQSDPPRKARNAGPLAEGVELAYSVIEKYIAEGRQTAEGISKQPYATRPASDNMQNVLERMLRFQAEILPLFIETLSTLVKVDPSRSNSGAPGNAWPHTNGGHKAETNTVSVDVVSPRPVEVSVELRPDAETQSLLALGLNAVDSSKPSLTAISFLPGDAPRRVRLRIEIPKAQPSGIYSGVIVNRVSGEAVGTLTVRMRDKP